MTATAANEVPFALSGADPILKVEDVSVIYKLPGGTVLEAVRHVNFIVEPGEMMGLVGESGCGKSTMAKAICGLEPLSSGTITFQGEQIKPLGLHNRSPQQLRIQMVFQNPYASLNPRRTIGSQIRDGLWISSKPGGWTVEQLLDAVEMPSSDAARYPSQFSGGQRQRIAIARAIATGPDLLIGDEPISSLDASLQSKVAQMMKDLAVEAGSSMLFISHDLAVVRDVVDTVAVMTAGQIVERGVVGDVWGRPQHAYTKGLLASIPHVDGLGNLPGGPL